MSGLCCLRRPSLSDRTYFLRDLTCASGFTTKPPVLQPRDAIDVQGQTNFAFRGFKERLPCFTALLNGNHPALLGDTFTYVMSGLKCLDSFEGGLERLSRDLLRRHHVPTCQPVSQPTSPPVTLKEGGGRTWGNMEIAAATLTPPPMWAGGPATQLNPPKRTTVFHHERDADRYTYLVGPIPLPGMLWSLPYLPRNTGSL